MTLQSTNLTNQMTHGTLIITPFVPFLSFLPVFLSSFVTNFFLFLPFDPALPLLAVPSPRLAPPSSDYSVVYLISPLLTSFQAVLLRPLIYPEGFFWSTPSSAILIIPPLLYASFHPSIPLSFALSFPCEHFLPPSLCVFPSLTRSPVNSTSLPLVPTSLPPSTQLSFSSLSIGCLTS